MNNKINMTILTFFGILTIYYDFGYCLYIPLIIYYLSRNIKNIYIILISSILSLLFSFKLLNIDIYTLLKTVLLPYLIFIIIVLFTMLISRKLTNIYINIIIVFMLNIIQVFLYQKGITNYLFFIIYILTSILLYIALDGALLNKIINKRPPLNSNISNLLLSMIAIIGGCNFKIFNISLGFIVSIFYTMYFSNYYKNYITIVYVFISTIILYILLKDINALIIPIVSLFYCFSYTYSVMLLSIFTTTLIILKTPFNNYLLILLLIEIILFEIIKTFISNRNIDLNKDNIISNTISKNILGYASFLDKFVNSFKETNEYNKLITESICNVLNNFCYKCCQYKECLGKYKNELYIYLKQIVEQNTTNELLKNCINQKTLLQYSKSISNKYALDTSKKTNSSLVYQIMGISSTLRKYAIELIADVEITTNIINKINNELYSNGIMDFNIEVVNPDIDDFLIILTTKDNKNEEIIKTIFEYHLNTLITINKEVKEKDILYTIIPKINISVQYGFGTLSAVNNICGDNYFIKELKNTKFVTAISDGMGKGYEAFKESNETLNLVSDIIEQNLEVKTSIEIINTYFGVREYLERYATLDLLEINRHNYLARFYKLGAATSYIIKDNGTITKILNQSLPFGIEENPKDIEYYLEDGDIIIMSSDGIFDNIIETNALDEYIKKIRGEAPQKIVYDLIQYTLNNKIKIKDDATLIALKIKFI